MLNDCYDGSWLWGDGLISLSGDRFEDGLIGSCYDLMTAILIECFVERRLV